MTSDKESLAPIWYSCWMLPGHYIGIGISVVIVVWAIISTVRSIRRDERNGWWRDYKKK